MSGKTFKPEQQRRKAIAYTIPNHLIDRLVTYAKYSNTSRSKVVSEALEIYLSVVEEEMYKKTLLINEIENMLDNLSDDDKSAFQCILNTIQEKTNMKREDILIGFINMGADDILSGNKDVQKSKENLSENLQRIKAIICKDAIQ